MVKVLQGCLRVRVTLSEREAAGRGAGPEGPFLRPTLRDKKGRGRICGQSHVPLHAWPPCCWVSGRWESFRGHRRGRPSVPL